MDPYVKKNIPFLIFFINLFIFFFVKAYIEAISLPYKGITDNQPITAVGWGQKTDSNDEFSEHLQFISVTTISNLECQMTYGNQIGDGVVCIAGNYNEGTCIVITKQI